MNVSAVLSEDMSASWIRGNRIVRFAGRNQQATKIKL